VLTHVKTEATGCCAFTQLRVMYHFKGLDKEKVDEVVERHRQSVQNWWKAGVGNMKGAGAPTLWCVASPGEDELREYLRDREWTEVMNLPRRNGYGPGINTLFIKEFDKGVQENEWEELV
jgi:hypothetical protein